MVESGPALTVKLAVSTVTVAVAVAVQLSGEVYVTVYVVVVAGVTVTLAVFPAPPLHEYVPPEISAAAEMVAVKPGQIVSLTVVSTGLAIT